MELTGLNYRLEEWEEPASEGLCNEKGKGGDIQEVRVRHACGFPWAALMECPALGGLNNRNIRHQGSRGQSWSQGVVSVGSF